MARYIKTKNNMLYIWQGIACFGIVCIHCRFPNIIGNVIASMSRFAVPLFLAISGYFFSKNSEIGCFKLKKKIIRNLRVFLSAFFIYFIYKVVTGELLLQDISAVDFIKLIVFNSVDKVCSPLWFLLAQIYCFIVFSLIEKNKKTYTISVYAMGLLIIHYFLRIVMFKKGFSLMGIQLSEDFIYRNWLMFGIPFFALGYCIRSKQEWIIKHINFFTGSIFIALGFIITLLERKVIGYELELYVGNVFVVVGIFIISIQKSGIRNNMLAYIGEKCALTIYIAHPMVMYITRIIINKLNLCESIVVQWMLPIIVMVISLCIALLIIKIKENRVVKCQG